MSELVAASFPSDMRDTKARKAIDALQAGGATVYAWALISRDRTGRIAVVRSHGEGAHTGRVAALIGLLDPNTLPVSGAEQARRLLDPTSPRTN